MNVNFGISGTRNKPVMALLGVMLAVCYGLASPNAQAAVTAGASGDIEMVMVTARRVEENIQEVPVAVTAFSQDDLKKAQILTYSDLAWSTPSLSFDATYGSKDGSYAIRGLGKSYAAGPSVTIYYSEAPNNTANIGGALYDMASVQVLKGPQGTLFGRATTGGAIVLTPKHPEFDVWSGSAEVTIGNLGRNNWTGVLNIPLVEGKLAARLSAHREHRDGYTRMAGSNSYLNKHSNDSVRLGIEWKPNERFSNYSLFEAGRFDNNPGGFVLVGFDPSNALFNLPASIDAPLGAIFGGAVFGQLCAASVGLGFSPDVNSCIDTRLRLLSVYKPYFTAEVARTSQGGDALRTTGISADFPHSDKALSFIFVNNTQYDLGDLGFSSVILKNNFSYQTGKDQLIIDTDGIPFEHITSYNGGIRNTQQVNGKAVYNWSDEPWGESWTEEFQITGATDQDRLTWILGGYYAYTPARTGTTGCGNLNKLFSGVLSPNYGQQCSANMVISGNSWERGFFGNFVLDLSGIADGLHFSAGIRTTTNRSELVAAAPTVSYPSGTIVPGNILSNPPLKTKGDGWSLVLDYQVNDDVMFYVTSRKGYKPGGINNIAGAEDAPGFTPTFGPETVQDWELGMKSQFDIGGVRGIFNIDVYKDNYDDIQQVLSVPIGPRLVAYNANVAKAVLQGIEAELTILATDRLTITGNYALNDTKFKDFFANDPLGFIRVGNPACDPAHSTPATCLIDQSDSAFPNAPKHKGSLTLRYQLAVAEEAGSVFASITGYRQSRQYWATTATPIIKHYGPLQGFDAVRKQVSQASYSLINARLDWENIYDSNVSFSLWVKNLTDKIYGVGVFSQINTLGINTKIFGEPRTYGATFNYAF